MPLRGNSIKLKADFQGIDPTSVEVIIYDENEQIMHGPITLDSTHVEEVGKYFYWYTLPMERDGKLYYEFKGMVDGKPILNRKLISKRWSNR